ncbi:hypothetical protein ACP70R_030111 [Stipagrostis hirtigluma subsp. patula]
MTSASRTVLRRRPAAAPAPRCHYSSCTGKPLLQGGKSKDTPTRLAPSRALLRSLSLHSLSLCFPRRQTRFFQREPPSRGYKSPVTPSPASSSQGESLEPQNQSRDPLPHSNFKNFPKTTAERHYWRLELYGDTNTEEYCENQEVVEQYSEVSVCEQQEEQEVKLKYENDQPLDRKGLGRKVIDKLQETYASDLVNMNFAYDGEKSLFTVGALQNVKDVFIVVLEDTSSEKTVTSTTPGGNGSLRGSDMKRMKQSMEAKTFKVELSLAGNVPMSSIAKVLRGHEPYNYQEALRVLDSVLRQNSAKQDLSMTVAVKSGPVIDFLLSNQDIKDKDTHRIDWGKTYTKALTMLQRASLVEKSRKNPRERKSALSVVLHRNYNSDDILKKCGISIAPEFAQVAGRVLQAPKLKPGDGWDLVVRNRRWNFNNNAMQIDREDGVIEERPKMRQRLRRTSGPWKRKCLADFGIFSQYLAPPQTIKDQYLTNALLKINAKLGGLNSLLQMEASRSIPLVLRAPTIIFGMDVSHGSPGQSDVPSIAAVELLRDFMSEDTKQQKPEKIIIFRDGVSEGQFNQVLNIELTQIIEACKFLDAKWSPKFTVIVAQKNHHTRFFLHNGPREDDVAKVSPGTVVDTGIYHPRNYDFYMCAHAGMIGTTRPTHYHVLHDDIGFSPNDLQELVRSLSYVYQRSTSVISLLRCTMRTSRRRRRQFVKFDDALETASSASGAPAPVPELPRLHESVRFPMFFC